MTFIRTHSRTAIPTSVRLVMMLIVIGLCATAAAGYTLTACTTTLLNTSGSEFLFSGCNYPAVSITISAASKVSFLNCNFQALVHPVAMSSYYLEYNGGQLAAAGTSLLSFATTTSSVTILITGGAKMYLTSGNADIFSFSGACTNLGLSIINTVITHPGTWTSVLYAASGISGANSALIVSSSSISTTRHIFSFSTSQPLSNLQLTISSSTLTASQYLWNSGSLSTVTFLFWNVTAVGSTTNNIAVWGAITNSNITFDGGKWTTSTVQTLWCSNFYTSGSIATSTLMLSNVWFNSVYPLRMQRFTATTIRIVSGTYLQSTTGDYAALFETGSGSCSGSIYIDSSRVYGYDCLHFRSQSISSLQITVVSSTMTGYGVFNFETSVSVADLSVSMLSSTIVGSASGFQLGPITSTLSVVATSCSIATQKYVYFVGAVSPTSAFVAMYSSTFTGKTSTTDGNSVLHVANSVSNLKFLVSSTSITSINNGWRQFPGYTFSNVSLSYMSSSVYHVGQLVYCTSAITGISVLFTGTSSSRSSLSTVGNVFSMTGETVMTVSNMGLTFHYTTISTLAVLCGPSTSNVTVVNPVVTVGSTVTLTGAGAVLLSSVQGGQFYFAQSSMTSTVGYHDFEGFLTDTAITVYQVTCVGSASSWGLLRVSGGGSGTSFNMISNSFTTASTQSYAYFIGTFGTFTGTYSMTVTNNYFSYSITAAGDYAMLVHFTSTTVTGANIKLSGNTIATSSAYDHKAVALNVGYSSILGSSTISIAATTFSTSTLQRLAVYCRGTSTIIGASITAQCMNLTTMSSHFMWFNVIQSSSVRLEATSIEQTTASTSAALYVDQSSSSALTVTMIQSYLHTPFVISAVNTSSVTSIVVGCSRVSKSYPMSKGSFVAGLQSVVSTTSNCATSYRGCRVTRTDSFSQEILSASQSFSSSLSQSLGPYLADSLGLQLLGNPTTGLATLKSSFYVSGGVPVFVITSDTTTTATAYVNFTLSPLQSDLSAASATYFRNPKAPTAIRLSGGLQTSLGQTTISSFPSASAQCSYLPCTIPAQVTTLLSGDVVTVGQQYASTTVNVFTVEYQNGLYTRTSTFYAVGNVTASKLRLTTSQTSDDAASAIMVAQASPLSVELTASVTDAYGNAAYLPVPKAGVVLITTLPAASSSFLIPSTGQTSHSIQGDLLFATASTASQLSSITASASGLVSVTRSVNVTKCAWNAAPVVVRGGAGVAPSVRFYTHGIQSPDTLYGCRTTDLSTNAVIFTATPSMDVISGSPCYVTCMSSSASSITNFAKVELLSYQGAASAYSVNVVQTAYVPGSRGLTVVIAATPIVSAATMLAGNQFSVCAAVSLQEVTTNSVIADKGAYSVSLASSGITAATSPASAAALSVGRTEVYETTGGWTLCGINVTRATSHDHQLPAGSSVAVSFSVQLAGVLQSGAAMTPLSQTGTVLFSTVGDVMCTTPSNRLLQEAPSIVTTTTAYTIKSVALALTASSVVTVLVDNASSCSFTPTADLQRLTSNLQTKCAPGLAPTSSAGVASVLYVLRPDGYYDVPPAATVSRITLPTPVATSVEGCPQLFFPSTALCPLNGSTPLTIRGVGFQSYAINVSWKFPTMVDPVYCLNLTVVSDRLMMCYKYPGVGTFGATQIRNASDLSAVFSQSNFTMSFTLENAVMCPLAPSSGLMCNGHGACDFTSGYCKCAVSAVDGYWAGLSCDACTAPYNRSVGCLKPCPTSDEGIVCSGVGYCNEGQCWCGSRWVSTTCYQCAGTSSPCSGHGTCDLSTGSCTCVFDAIGGYYNGSGCEQCADGFSGSQCTLPCPVRGGLVCSGNGACQNGACFCVGFYCGVYCEIDKRTQDCLSCATPALYGAACRNVCPGSQDPFQPCVGHGTCDAGQLGTGLCKCVAGYGSPDCSVACPTFSGVLCAGHGLCSGATGQCQCDRFYATPACGVRCPFFGGVACSGHGTCSEGSGGSGKCICDTGFGSAACNVSCQGVLPCSGHGVCEETGMCTCFGDSTNGYWNSSACDVCSSGWLGPNCNQRCPQDAQGTPCSGHGTCGADLSCKCYASFANGHWSGAACGDCFPGYYGPTCTNECPGGSCNPCNSNGVCSSGMTGSGACSCIDNDAFGHWAGDSCQSCSSGYFGARCRDACPRLGGKVCPNGVCDGGVTGSGMCVCATGFKAAPSGHCILCATDYFGPLCLACPATANGTCNGRGKCDDGVGGTGVCKCFGTAGGALCNSTCPAMPDGTICGNGVCATTGCDCDANFTTDSDGLCSRCVEGNYGASCNLTCGVCQHGVCARFTGVCQCTRGYWGATCSQECAGGANNSCSGHGACDMATGECRCYASRGEGYYVGDLCDRCDPRYNSPDCTVACPVFLNKPCMNRGTCWNGNCTDCAPTAADAGVVFVCGDACEKTNEECFATSCPIGYYGNLCDQLCPGAERGRLEATTCAGNGKCDVAGICHCTAGHFGTDCSSSCQANVVDGVLRICSGRGSCRAGSCLCLNGYFGVSCQYECPGGAANICNGRGQCANGTCTCAVGANGAACELLCPGGVVAPCNYHGVCQSTGACLCHRDPARGFYQGSSCSECLEGYTGRSCMIRCPAARGVVKNLQCACFEGFAGADCSEQCTPDAQNLICGGHGTCMREEFCRCDKDYYGPKCSQFCTAESCAPHNSPSKMQCNASTGACECRWSTIGKWTGPLCNVCDLSVWGAECNFPCLCNGHGTCSPTTGRCTCYRDDTHGFWNGTACAQCCDGYIGEGCLTVNAQISTATLPSIVSKSSPSTPSPSWLFNDPVTGLLLRGHPSDATLYVLGMNPGTGRVDVLNAIPSPLGVTACLVQSRTALVMVLVGGERITVPRSRTTLISLGALTVGSSRRSFGAASLDVSAPLYFSIPDTPIWCNVTWLGPAPDAVQCDSLFSLGGLKAALGMADVSLAGVTADGNYAVLVGAASASGGVDADWIVASWNISTRTAAAPNVSTVPSLFTVSAASAGKLLRCTFSSGSDVICLVSSRAQRRVSLVKVSAVTGAVLLQALVVSTVQECNATAMGADVSFDIGFVAYNLPLVSSTVLKFQLSNLLPVGTFQCVGLFVVTSLIVDSANRLLIGVMEDNYGVAYITLNLFGITSVAPDIVDLAGGALITVTGTSFDTSRANETYCVLSGVPIAGVLTSPTTVVCKAPQANNSLSVCSKDSLNIRFGSRTTSQSTVMVYRPVSAVVVTATTDYGTRSYATFDIASNATLVGMGFINSRWAACRLVTRQRRVIFRSTAVRYLNTSAVMCEYAAPVPPSDGWTGIEYSHDGTFFGSSAATFIIVGPTAAVESTATAFEVAASRRTSLPNLTIYTTDRFGNRRLDLETVDDVVRCSTNTPSVAISNAPELLAMYDAQAFVARVRSGVASFGPDAALVLPPAGDVTFYCFLYSDTTISTSQAFRIVPGPPVRLVMKKSGGGRAPWVAGVTAPTRLDPAPVLYAVDEADNQVTDISALPPFAKLVTYVAWPKEDKVHVFYNQSVYTALPSDGGVYDFGKEVTVRTAFDVDATLTFVAGGLVTLVERVPQERCVTGTEYAEAFGLRCFACPSHGICNGTSQILTETGYWRGSRLSTQFLECSPAAACPSASECGVGYDGVLCGTCLPGYGRAQGECQQCAPWYINWLLNVVGFLVIVGMVFQMTIMSMPIASLEEFELRSKFKKLKEHSANSVAIKILTSHLQMLANVPYGKLALPIWMKSFFATSKSASSANPNLSFVSCAIAPRTIDKLYLTVELIPLLMVVFFVISAVVAWLRSANDLVEKEDDERRQMIDDGRLSKFSREVYEAKELEKIEKKRKRENRRGLSIVGERRRSRKAAIDKSPDLLRSTPDQDDVVYDKLGETPPPAGDDTAAADVVAERRSDVEVPIHVPDDVDNDETAAAAPRLVELPDGATAPFSAAAAKDELSSDKSDDDIEMLEKKNYVRGNLVRDYDRQVRLLNVMEEDDEVKKDIIVNRSKYFQEDEGADANHFGTAVVFVDMIAKAQEAQALVRQERFLNRFVNMFLVSIMGILFQLYPTLMEYGALLLQCQSIDTDNGVIRVLRSEPSVNCDSKEYLAMRATALTVLIVSAIGVPIAACGFIFATAAMTCKGNMEAAQHIFFFISGRYHPDLWFWESFSLLKKLALVVATILLPELGLQILCSMWFLLLSLYINIKVEPWMDDFLDVNELVSLSVLATSYGLIELLFFGPIQESEPTKNAIFALLLLINIVALVQLVGTVLKTAQVDVGTLMKKNNIVGEFLRMIYDKWVNYQMDKHETTCEELIQSYYAKDLRSIRNMERVLLQAERLHAEATTLVADMRKAEEVHEKMLQNLQTELEKGAITIDEKERRERRLREAYCSRPGGKEINDIAVESVSDSEKRQAGVEDVPTDSGNECSVKEASATAEALFEQSALDNVSSVRKDLGDVANILMRSIRGQNPLHTPPAAQREGEAAGRHDGGQGIPELKQADVSLTWLTTEELIPELKRSIDVVRLIQLFTGIRSYRTRTKQLHRLLRFCGLHKKSSAALYGAVDVMAQEEISARHMVEVWSYQQVWVQQLYDAQEQLLVAFYRLAKSVNLLRGKVDVHVKALTAEQREVVRDRRRVAGLPPLDDDSIQSAQALSEATAAEKRRKAALLATGILSGATAFKRHLARRRVDKMKRSADAIRKEESEGVPPLTPIPTRAKSPQPVIRPPVREKDAIEMEEIANVPKKSAAAAPLKSGKRASRVRYLHEMVDLTEWDAGTSESK